MAMLLPRHVTKKVIIQTKGFDKWEIVSKVQGSINGGDVLKSETVENWPTRPQERVSLAPLGFDFFNHCIPLWRRTNLRRNRTIPAHLPLLFSPFSHFCRISAFLLHNSLSLLPSNFFLLLLAVYSLQPPCFPSLLFVIEVVYK